MMKVERKGRNWETGNRTFIHGGGLLCSPWFQFGLHEPDYIPATGYSVHVGARGQAAPRLCVIQPHVLAVARPRRASRRIIGPSKVARRGTDA